MRKLSQRMRITERVESEPRGGFARVERQIVLVDILSFHDERDLRYERDGGEGSPDGEGGLDSLEDGEILPP